MRRDSTARSPLAVGGGGHQPVAHTADRPAAPPRRGRNRRAARPTKAAAGSHTVGVDVDDRGLQFRMLEGQHPRDSTKSALRHRDSITGSSCWAPRVTIHSRGLLRTPSCDTVLTISAISRVRDCDQVRVASWSGQRFVDGPGRAHHDDAVPGDVLAGDRRPQLVLVVGRYHLAVRDMSDELRPQSVQQRIRGHRSAAGAPMAATGLSRFTGSHSRVNSRLVSDLRRRGACKHRHLDFVDLQQHPPVGIGEPHAADEAIGARCRASASRSHGRLRSRRRTPGCPPVAPAAPRRVVAFLRGEVGGQLGGAKCLQRDVDHDRVQQETSGRLLRGRWATGPRRGPRRIDSGAQPDDALEGRSVLLAGAAQPPIQFVGIKLRGWRRRRQREVQVGDAAPRSSVAVA